MSSDGCDMLEDDGYAEEEMVVECVSCVSEKTPQVQDTSEVLHCDYAKDRNNDDSSDLEQYLSACPVPGWWNGDSTGSDTYTYEWREGDNVVCEDMEIVIREFHVSEEELEADRVRDANELLDEAVSSVPRTKDVMSKMYRSLSYVNDIDDVKHAIANGATVTDEVVVRAVLRNDSEIVRAVLGGGGDANAVVDDMLGCYGGSTVLGYAVKYGQIKIVRELLDAGAWVDGCEGDWMTPLMWGSYCDQLVCVKMLLAAGADVNAIDALGRSALLFASADGGHELVQYLLYAGANPNLQDYTGTTPLIATSRYGVRTWMASDCRRAVATVLLRAGADPNAVDRHGSTSLLVATEYNMAEFLKDVNIDEMNKYVRLLLAAGANVNAVGWGGNTPLMNACRSKLYKGETMVQILLSAGADINAGNQEAVTPLMMAAQFNSARVLRVLLGHGADVNTCNIYGTTALMCAVSDNSYESVRCLVGAGANVDAQDRTGMTPLMAVFARGHGQNFTTESRRRLAQLLLLEGADVNLVDRKRNTALYYVTQYHMSPSMSPSMSERHVNEMHAMLRMLITAGARVNAIGENGFTPLMNVCRCQTHCGESMVDLLLDAGANINVADDDGMTALMLAADHNDHRVIGTLLNRGADVNRRNKDGNVVAQFIILDYEYKTAILLMRAGSDISCLNMDRNCKLHAAHEEWQRGKLWLQHLCREQIRERLMARFPGMQIGDVVQQLGLPARLQEFVADVTRFVLYE